MSLPVILRTEAQAEFDEAFDWYENQRPGLGVDFAERVQEVFDRISANPHIHGVVFQDIRNQLFARTVHEELRFGPRNLLCRPSDCCPQRLLPMSSWIAAWDDAEFATRGAWPII